MHLHGNRPRGATGTRTELDSLLLGAEKISRITNRYSRRSRSAGRAKWRENDFT